jgi:hypothetical protein
MEIERGGRIPDHDYVVLRDSVRSRASLLEGDFFLDESEIG